MLPFVFVLVLFLHSLFIFTPLFSGNVRVKTVISPALALFRDLFTVRSEKSPHNAPTKTTGARTMNKSLLAGTILGVAVATAGGAVAGYKFLDREQYADVLDVKPIKETVR